MKPQQSKFLTFFNSKAFIFLGLVLIFLLSLAFYKEYSRQEKVNAEISQLEEEIKSYDESSYDLARLINYLKTDDYVEMEARRTLGFRKQGERVIIIKNEEPVAEVLGEQERANLTNAEKWFNYFFGKLNSNTL